MDVKKLLNEMVVLVNHTKTAEKDKRSETKRKANKNMKRENESVYLSAKLSTVTNDTGSPSHHTTVSDTKMNGMSFETSLYTRLKFIPPTKMCLLHQNISSRFLCVKQ